MRDKSTGSVVGWLSGEQHDWETFYLRNSGFVPSARRKGLYTSIHSDIINYLQQQGFGRVVSDHSPNNRPILLMKIKFGYYVNSVTIDERFGPHVRLVYLIDKARRRQFEERFGLNQYDE